MTQNNRPFIIGVSGGIGSGKSTVSAFMAKREDACLIDADLLSREAVADKNILSAIKKHFGIGVFDENGDLRRRELGRIIFSSPEEREFLNSLTHPYIRNRFFELVKENCDKKFIIYDCPLLFEASLCEDVDVSVLVFVSKEAQTERIMARDGFDREEALMRIEAQMDTEEKLKLADCVIYNDADLNALEKTCERLPDMLREKCR